MKYKSLVVTLCIIIALIVGIVIIFCYFECFYLGRSPDRKETGKVKKAADEYQKPLDENMPVDLPKTNLVAFPCPSSHGMELTELLLEIDIPWFEGYDCNIQLKNVSIYAVSAGALQELSKNQDRVNDLIRMNFIEYSWLRFVHEGIHSVRWQERMRNIVEDINQLIGRRVAADICIEEVEYEAYSR